MGELAGRGETGMGAETRNVKEMDRIGLAAYFSIEWVPRKNKTFDCTFCIPRKKDSSLRITYSLRNISALKTKIWQL